MKKPGKTFISAVVLSAVAATSYIIMAKVDSAAPVSPAPPPDSLARPADHVGHTSPAALPAAEAGLEAEIIADLEKPALSADLEKELAVIEQELEQTQMGSSVNPWAIGAVIPAGAVALDEKIESKEPISFDADQAANVTVGDLVQLPLPGTAPYEAIVADVNIHENGETSWSGYLQGYDQDYPVVFTIGEQSSFATITTPEGLYTMEAADGNGWVYKTPDLIDLVDPDQPDHLITDTIDDTE